jgi:aspartyl-tRNA(Asn)/glutamyl-tRNA(Gln) amidotransferase subunit A
MKSIHYMSAHELVGLVRTRELSPVEVMKETLDRIEAVNPLINAFVAMRAEEAIQEAKELESRIASGVDPGPLAGIPVGVKDLEDVEGMVTSFGSIPYKENLSDHDSVQVARLRRAGAIIVGKTNTPEFGFTGFTKNRLYGVTRNPWDRERTPGGSSGGSAAAVAAGMVPLATGSDAGGSIRIPACYSGCFGLKPTYGRIPLGPVKRLYTTRTWTLGPLARTVEDAALYLDCTAGAHPADPDSLVRSSFSYMEALKKRPGGWKIGFSPALGYARVQKEVMAMVEKAAASFEAMGHHVDIWNGALPDVSQAWSDLMNWELYGQLHHDLGRIRSELGRTLVQSLESAKELTIHDHLRIQEIRTALNRVLWEAFDRFDLLLTPAMPTEAFGAKGPPPAEIDGRPIPLLGAVAFTYPFNLSGHPAATVRVGLTQSGLPAGLQIVGPRHRDGRVLQAAYLYGQAFPWDDHWPDLQMEASMSEPSRFKTRAEVEIP